MKRDSRLSMTLHAVLHMADAERPLTSEELAEMLQTNPVVVRRTMAGLRKAKLVRSTKGHGGGWELVRAPANIKLGDIYDALAAPTLFAMADRTESPGCLVEQAVNRAMHDAFAEAEAVLLARFRSVSLADIAADVKRHRPRSSNDHDHEARRHHHRR
jgi:Rrf2 family protein